MNSVMGCRVYWCYIKPYVYVPESKPIIYCCGWKYAIIMEGEIKPIIHHVWLRFLKSACGSPIALASQKEPQQSMLSPASEHRDCPITMAGTLRLLLNVLHVCTINIKFAVLCMSVTFMNSHSIG